jgi:hypothetical protein
MALKGQEYAAGLMVVTRGKQADAIFCAGGQHGMRERNFTVFSTITAMSSNGTRADCTCSTNNAKFSRLSLAGWLMMTLRQTMAYFGFGWKNPANHINIKF